ncbi:MULTISPECIES: hypothetical protein [unclassified Flavobacterium]|uniref:hypothetical protein n=1 Tax=unclassified Flavobacterium TaxID=196869 RepID=UPI00095EB728|nr:MULTISPECIES: hypothetical protein [unclassified Flavobacterium]MBN9284966.1 hypothetical protein [Flavobacterium sp.]OJV72272.1 MAG: hypothetical protein BGO42_03560 [Flavobacterium sp. 40-81]
MDANFEIVDKELIEALSFPESDVLDDDKAAITRRMEDLNRALTLGNLEHLKIKIYFEDNVSKKMVETTIWGVTDERIILKQGVVIPVRRIYKTI